MRSSKPLYGILGAYIPLSVLVLWAPLPGAFYRYFASPSPGLVFNEGLWCLAGLLTALGASVYVGIIKKAGISHTAADIRGSIIVAVLAYALLSLSRQNIVFIMRFIPSIDTIVAALAAFFVWFSVISLREIFSGLELYESFAAQHQGEQLRAMVREFSPEISQTNLRLKSFTTQYAVQLVPPCLFLIAASFLSVPLPLMVFVLLIFIAGFLILGFLHLLRRELLYASEGISLTVRDRSRPLPVMAIGIGITALLALMLSTDTSLLPPALLLYLLRLLEKLLSLLFRPVDPSELPPPDFRNQSMQGNPMADLFPMEEERGPSPFWNYVKYGFLVLAVCLFLFFMIKPLLERRGFTIKWARIRDALIHWFQELNRGLSAFFAAILDKGSSTKIRKVDQEKLRRIASELLSGGIRKEVKRSVNLFARLVLWGIETLDIPWKPSIAPGEYCALLAAKTKDPPEVEDPASGENQGKKNVPRDIIRCGELFEKALYSTRLLSTQEEQDFRRMVKEITGS